MQSFCRQKAVIRSWLQVLDVINVKTISFKRTPVSIHLARFFRNLVRAATGPSHPWMPLPKATSASVTRLGKGLQRTKQAAFWYRKAAEQGSSVAQRNFDIRYSEGRGVMQDNSQAYVWLSVAAANGQTEVEADRNYVAEKLSRSHWKQRKK
ncbi:tetratricopeptide repeat protein [Pseudomonas sp. EL_65y_Pfl2_R96]|uniref:tetratricopeptide repeat protein n=1 Tax=Pseudomonas sp. EL_65y_Pfl2_R96 TaxID=3088699 RepID=UPI0030D82B4A